MCTCSHFSSNLDKVLPGNQRNLFYLLWQMPGPPPFWTGFQLPETCWADHNRLSTVTWDVLEMKAVKKECPKATWKTATVAHLIC